MVKIKRKCFRLCRTKELEEFIDSLGEKYISDELETSRDGRCVVVVRYWY